MSQVQPASPRKVFIGIASRSQMFALFNRHHQAPFDDDRMTGRLYAGEWFKIDRASYYSMLEVLPPLIHRPDCFAMREFQGGSVTSVFYELRIGGRGRWFHAYVDLADRQNIDVMRAAIIERETSPPLLTREESLEHVWSTTHDDFRGYAREGRHRTITAYEPGVGTVLHRLCDLSAEEISARLAPTLTTLAAA